MPLGSLSGMHEVLCVHQSTLLHACTSAWPAVHRGDPHVAVRHATGTMIALVTEAASLLGPSYSSPDGLRAMLTSRIRLATASNSTSKPC